MAIGKYFILSEPVPFARVYRAVHEKTGEIKAVKVLRQRYSNDMETREQFLREARMVMKLRHPNIVPIHEVEEDKTRIYMVMDFVEGQNLREYVKAHNRLPVITVLENCAGCGGGIEVCGRAQHHPPRYEVVECAAVIRRAGETGRLWLGQRQRRR